MITQKLLACENRLTEKLNKGLIDMEWSGSKTENRGSENVKHHTTPTKSSSPHIPSETGWKSATVIQESQNLENCWWQTSVLDSKMGKNPKNLLGIPRKRREAAIQKTLKLLYILTVMWPQLENCDAFVSSFDKYIVELGKNIENSHKVGQWYKISSECGKMKQTGIF